MSRRSRLHYHLATIGYWASRMKARSPRPDSLLGDSLSFGAAVRYELPSHTTSRQNRHPDLSRRDDSCNCFSLMVTSDRSHKGLSPSITAPPPAHLPPVGFVAGIENLSPTQIRRSRRQAGSRANDPLVARRSQTSASNRFDSHPALPTGKRPATIPKTKSATEHPAWRNRLCRNPLDFSQQQFLHCFFQSLHRQPTQSQPSTPPTGRSFLARIGLAFRRKRDSSTPGLPEVPKKSGESKAESG